jgi:DNA-binding HxlR family transcriptional regulator
VVTRRSYNQYCGIARALDLIGERWGLLVVRELVLGPKRFTDLRHGLPGIATNVLSQRLRELEQDGVVARRRLPPPAASDVYELTEYGEELVPIMLALGRWGARTMGARSPEQTLRPEWLAVALQAYYQPRAAKGLSARIRLDLGDAAFTVHLRRGRLDIVPGAFGPADLTIAADPDTLVGFLAGAPVHLEAEGDRELLERLPAIFAFGLQKAGGLETRERAARVPQAPEHERDEERGAGDDRHDDEAADARGEQRRQAQRGSS